MAAREVDERLAPLGGEADAGGILEVGDRVQELGRATAGEHAPELVDVEPVLVQRHAVDLRLEPLEGHDRAEVGRRFDEHPVARVHEGLADELERLDGAARQHQLPGARPEALEPLQPVGDEIARAGQALGRRVLERRGVALLGELGQDLGDHRAGERRGIREAARERDDVLGPGQREDLEEAVTPAGARARGEERLPAANVGLDRHVEIQAYRADQGAIVTSTEPSGPRSKWISPPSATSSAGTTVPAMTTSPARSRSPKASSRSAM